MKYTFEVIALHNILWEEMTLCYDHTVFKSKNWSNFLKEFYKVDPFVVSVSEKDRVIGYFYGQKIKKFGFQIVASPFEGWSTSFQGLSMLKEISVNQRLDIYEELIPWLFENKHCSYFQVLDWQLEVAECLHRNFTIELTKGYVLDLTKEKEELYKNMSYSSVRYSINKSQKKGVEVKEICDINEYVQEYNQQLEEVFNRQGLKPTHSKEQTAVMLKNTLSENMLALYAVNSEGQSLGSAFFPYAGNYGFFSGGASYQSSQSLCPNEPIMWNAIERLKDKGVKYMEFGGGRRYKEKYGPLPYVKPKIIAAKYEWLIPAKSFAKSSFYGVRKIKALLKGKKVNNGINAGI